MTLRRHKAAAASSSSSARALNYEYADGVDYRGLTAFASLSMAVSGGGLEHKMRAAKTTKPAHSIKAGTLQKIRTPEAYTR
ncbi:hypothetical protein [Candidatus Reidiella endopervernicosa]|uniref:Uncharacterized protein n=1 Tax=Candidatus Reidiella endopervernicosa TaxID=2738883 RepID=A0A6N0HTP3_9GAMM|nr:hypothetical protein [Candidatus Reidiella endopervernicosa]QKQ25765.1 hypothetical protein HUE57_05305 [Candidatus Reidiella endopervernicosa]